MKEFSIDLRASAKGERKKAVQYLRERGFNVARQKDCFCLEYLSNSGAEKPYDYAYFGMYFDEETILTLPQDWDKFVRIVGEGKDTVENTFEEGRWYKLKDGNSLSCYSRDTKGYGFDHRGDWQDVMFMRHVNCWTPATEAQVEKALKKEAVKRGFVKGVTVKCLNDWGSLTIDQDILSWYEIEGCLWASCRGTSPCIFRNGKWAEIIEEEVPSVGGYKLERVGRYSGSECKWKFGCYAFTTSSVKRARHLLKLTEASSIKINGHDVTKDDLDKIINYITKHNS